MKYKQSFRIALAISSLLVAPVVASPAQAMSPGYAYSTDGKTLARDKDGHCVRTYEWRKELAIAECDSEVPPAPKVAAPAPAPKPEPKPEPAPAPAPAPKAEPADSDKDGVPDSADKCANTPADVKVDDNGCPLDSDKDGVPDYLDKCADTPSGSRVDKVGCVVSITLKVNFDPGKAVVKTEYQSEIERFAKFMNQYPEVKAQIAGHTDNRGDAKKNKALSEARAKAVMDVAVSKFGIAADRLTAKGYGQDKPIASNATPEGREQNRRVEAVIIK
ncbi:MAG TPA: OmpA family protein [Nitrospirota bacterium]